MKYFINRTFSFLGTEKQCRHFHRSLSKTKFTIEHSDFVGEKLEHHSGSFTEEIKLDGENKLVDLVRLYIQDEANEMRGECFSIVDEENNVILEETDLF